MISVVFDSPVDDPNLSVLSVGDFDRYLSFWSVGSASVLSLWRQSVNELTSGVSPVVALKSMKSTSGVTSIFRRDGM